MDSFFSPAKGINLDITTKCSLECPGCERQKFKECDHYNVPGEDLSIENFTKISDYFTHIDFCGQRSDPTLHPNFIDMLKITYDKNIRTEIKVAATARSTEWFEEAFRANPAALWEFGIDGLPEESSTYRINQDGNKLFDIMKLCKSMGVDAKWAYIIFEYNKDHIHYARNLAKANGINIEFKVSHRFGVDENKPTQGNLSTISKNEIAYDKEQFDPKCVCLSGYLQKFGFSSLGFVLPCCWHNYIVDNYNEYKLLKQYIDDSFAFLYNLVDPKFNISNVDSIEEIFTSKEWQAFKTIIEHRKTDLVKTTCGLKCKTGYTNVLRMDYENYLEFIQENC